MPYIKPRNLHSQHGVGYHGSFLGVADGALVVNDVVIVSGVSGDRLKFTKADANAANKRAGLMGIADHAAPDGGSVRIVSHKIITTAIDTSGSALGAPVYLSDTAGGHVISAPTEDVIIGNVLSLHATTGQVVIAPAQCIGAVSGQAWTA